ncbi:unnamed protein product [Closterium sp. NIES-53]
MARLRALSLAASVILVLLCKSGSEAVRLTPTTRTTATPGNATASGGNAATNKTASTSTPKVSLPACSRRVRMPCDPKARAHAL